MMQSAGDWYFDKDGNPNILDNAPLKAALETYGKLIWQAMSSSRSPAGPTSPAPFTSGDVAAAIDGVWMTGTVKSQADQSGKWGVAPIPKLTVDGATILQRRRLELVRARPRRGKDDAIDFLKTIWAGDMDFYQKILVGQGAVGSLLAARAGDAYAEADAFFGGQPVWQNFSDWLAKIPRVNYGIFTAEVDAAVVAQLPAIAKGGSVDDALKAIDEQVKAQIQ